MKIITCGMIMTGSLGITQVPILAQTNFSEHLSMEKKNESQGGRNKRDVSDQYFIDVPAPEKPETPLPESGEKRKIVSAPEKYVYLNVVATKELKLQTFVPRNHIKWEGKNNPFDKAILLDKDFKEIPKQEPYKLSGLIKPGETIITIAIPKDEELVDGVKTIKEYYYRLINRDRVAKETQVEFNKTISYGTTKEKAMMIGKTLGIEFGLNGLSQIPLMASLTHMSQISETWGTSISNETTIHKRFDLGKADAGYSHPYYWLGIYQAMIDYSVESTPKLDCLLADLNKKDAAIHIVVPNKQSYALDLLHPVRTKGTGAYISSENE